jgi:hypothetical protein
MGVSGPVNSIWIGEGAGSAAGAMFVLAASVEGLAALVAELVASSRAAVVLASPEPGFPESSE